MSEANRCSNIGEYVFGLGDDIRRAREVAALSLVRFPSEAAYFSATTNFNWGTATRTQLRKLYAESGVELPLPARILWFEKIEQLLGVPGIGTCTMLAEVINTVS